MSARVRRRRRNRFTLGEYLRSFGLGVVYLVLAGAVALLASTTGDVLSGYAAFNVTIGGNTITLDLGFIPKVAGGIAAVLMFMYGLYRVARVRL